MADTLNKGELVVKCGPNSDCGTCALTSICKTTQGIDLFNFKPELHQDYEIKISINKVEKTKRGK